MPTPPHNSRLFRRQVLLLALLISGYSGFYLCRSNFSATLPLLRAGLVEQGFDPDEAKVRLGVLASIGIFAYALGKFIGGAVTDRLGGRRAFLGSMMGSVMFTLLFAVSGTLPLFTLAWIGNRFVQSFGWPGMVKLCGRWFSFARYGTVMGMVSLSYLFGDAAARLFLGKLIGLGLSWSGVFVVCAVVLSAIFVACLVGLRETPRLVDLPEPPANPLNVYGHEGEKVEKIGWKALLGPLMRTRGFWYVCLLSVGCTQLREVFNNWTPTYFTEGLGLSPAPAAAASSVFSFFGGVSVLLAGYGSDRLGRTGRAQIITAGLALAAIVLLLLGGVGESRSTFLSVALVGLVAVLVLGPYSYLAGALSLDFGGKRGAATACGIIDGVGYLAAALAVDRVGRFSVTLGWDGAFRVLAAVALLSSIVGVLFWAEQRSKSTQEPTCKSPTN
jgi:OPA family glycerol-3-phosphate transporter-like MFS transporter